MDLKLEIEHAYSFVLDNVSLLENGTTLVAVTSTIPLGTTTSFFLTEIGKLVQTVFAIFIVLVSILGNLLTCATIVRLQKRRDIRKSRNMTVMGILLLNLAISDIAAAILVMPFSIIQTFFPKVMLVKGICIYACLGQRLFLTTSIFLLTAISVARYYGVCKGENGWRFHVKTAVFFCWLLGVVNMLVPLVNLQHIQFSPMFEICDTLTSYSLERTQLIDFLVLGVEYAVCLGVIIFSYLCIFGRTKATFKDSIKTGVRDEKSSAKSERRITLMLLSCVVLYFMCWTPLLIHLTYMHITAELISLEYAIFSVWLAYANSALNPLVYTFSSTLYRNEIKQLLQDLVSCRRKRSSPKSRIVAAMMRQTSSDSMMTSSSVITNGSSMSIDPVSPRSNNVFKFPDDNSQLITVSEKKNTQKNV